MQFAQAERAPTPLPACKLTLIKIHNFFFFGQTTHNELKFKGELGEKHIIGLYESS